MYNNFSQFPSYTPVSSYSQIANQFGQQNSNPYYQNFQYNNPNSQANSNITFVNGIEGAKAFQVSPNSSVLLMDSDNSKFYVKSTDSLGVAKISSYSFIGDESLQQSQSSSSVPAESVEESSKLYDELNKKVADIDERLTYLSNKLEPLIKE